MKLFCGNSSNGFVSPTFLLLAQTYWGFFPRIQDIKINDLVTQQGDLDVRIIFSQGLPELKK